jgi:hypothetical protein
VQSRRCTNYVVRIADDPSRTVRKSAQAGVIRTTQKVYALTRAESLAMNQTLPILYDYPVGFYAVCLIKRTSLPTSL